jgi:hypothetical protein
MKPEAIMHLRLPVLGLTLLAAAGFSLRAQPVATARAARILPVGEAPPFIQEIRGDVRYEVEPPEDSLPPREVLGSAEGSPVRLRLGMISAPIPVAAGRGPLVIRRAAAPEAASPWLGSECPEKGDFLIVVCRKPGAAGWRETLHRVLPDGPLGAPAGSVRIANLYPQAVRISWGGESITMAPGADVVRTAAAGSATPFAVLSIAPEGAPKRYFSSTITQHAGERGWIILYRADGDKPRRPLKVTILREPVAPLTPPVPARPAGRQAAP